MADASNLIDLKNAEEVGMPLLVPPKSPNYSEILSPQNGSPNRLSLDNNPFDLVSKQAQLFDDPFECVARAELQKRHVPMSEVETVNLLGLDDSIVQVQRETINSKPASHPSRFGSNHSNALSSISSLNSCPSPSNYSDSVFSSIISPIPPENESQKANEFLMISDPLNKAFIADSECEDFDSAGKKVVKKAFQIPTIRLPSENETLDDNVFLAANNTSESGNTSPKVVEHSSKKSNESSGESKGSRSNTQSPLNTAHCSTSIRAHLLKLSLSNSPFGSPSNRGGSADTSGAELAERLCKMIMSPNLEDTCDDLNATKPIWVDSESDSDLESMKIPMLQKIERNEAKGKTASSLDCKSGDKANVLVDLQTIRDRINRHEAEQSNSKEPDDLIDSLKQIALNCSNEEQKTEANKLLSSLSTLLGRKDTNNTNKSEVPHPMIRQDTFDLDKSDRSDNSNRDDVLQTSPNVAAPLEASHTPGQITADVANIAEQIGRLLGNQSLNIVQANLGSSTARATTNATYIVVMGTPMAPPPVPPATPIRQNTQILVNSTTSPELKPQSRGRSQSLRLHDKPLKRPVIPASNASTTASNTLHPPYMPKHRVSIGNSPAILSYRARAIHEASSPRPKVERRNSLTGRYDNFPTTRDTSTAREMPRSLSNLRSDFTARNLKLKKSETVTRKIGPVRATVPVNRVSPMIVTSSVSSPITSDKKLNLITSTPIPPMNSLKTFPVSCSTPATRSTLVKDGSAPEKRESRSYLSATPQPKSTSSRLLGSSLTRRRSKTESKSPKRLHSESRDRNRLSGNAMATNLRRSSSWKAGTTAGPKSKVVEKNKENARPK